MSPAASSIALRRACVKPRLSSRTCLAPECHDKFQLSANRASEALSMRSNSHLSRASVWAFSPSKTRAKYCGLGLCVQIATAIIPDSSPYSPGSRVAGRRPRPFVSQDGGRSLLQTPGKGPRCTTPSTSAHSQPALTSSALQTIRPQKSYDRPKLDASHLALAAHYRPPPNAARETRSGDTMAQSLPYPKSVSERGPNTQIPYY